MHHEMLTQRTFFAITRNTKRDAESAFCDVCRTSSELVVYQPFLYHGRKLEDVRA